MLARNLAAKDHRSSSDFILIILQNAAVCARGLHTIQNLAMGELHGVKHSDGVKHGDLLMQKSHLLPFNCTQLLLGQSTTTLVGERV
jgi:hypothetical protein